MPNLITCMIVTNLLMIAYHGVTSVAEVAILTGSIDSKYECGPAIWYCIMGCSIIHGIMFTLVACKLTHLGYVRDVDKLDILLNQCYSLLFVLGIWACVCFYDTRLECIELFKDEYSKLWIMINVEVIAFFVIFGCILLYATGQLYCPDYLTYDVGGHLRDINNQGRNISPNEAPEGE